MKPLASSDGFTLLEVVFALFLIAVGVIATAPLFVYAAQENASGGDAGIVGAVAVQRMEQLRAVNFNNLTPGGSLEANEAGYFDNSNPEFLVRWSIVANPNPPAQTAVIQVRVVTSRVVVGRTREIVLTTLRGA
jgi:prepilin-type N-terminal cleavage/methylation domain-containing protein